MLYEKFLEKISSMWKAYFVQVEGARRDGRLEPSEGYRIFFPNMMVVTSCEGYFVCELVGVDEVYGGLSVRRHKGKTIYGYLSQFDDSKPDPMFFIEKSATFSNLVLSQKADIVEVGKRFPSAELYGSCAIRDNGRGSALDFGSGFEFCFIDNCVLINAHEQLVRCKNILHVFICKKSINNAEIEECFREYFNGPVKGVHNVNSDSVALQLVAGQLQNMYLWKGLHETTLGEFLKLHPDVVKKAFKADSFYYEPYLKWVEHDGSCTDDAINPDLIVVRVDGCCDIYDLKTALLDRRSVTKGERRRRRFIDYVEEGIAQLANYREYFEYSANAEHAFEKYGMKVTSPDLVLVVGNWDNTSPHEVLEASRRYPEIRIIDYDTLCHLFLSSDLEVAHI